MGILRYFVHVFCLYFCHYFKLFIINNTIGGTVANIKNCIEGRGRTINFDRSVGQEPCNKSKL